MAATSVELYKTHMSEVTTIRSAIGAAKVLLDTKNFRNAMINLNNVEADLLNLPYPQELIGRLGALSEAFMNFEQTLGQIEDGIRGSLNYPNDT